MNDTNKIESEVEELRRTWYQYVLTSLEKLDDRIDSLSKDTAHSKETLRKEITQCIKVLKKEMEVRDIEYKTSIDDKFTPILADLITRLEKLEDDSAIKILKKELSQLKDKYTDEINRLRTDELSLIKVAIARIDTKVIMLAAIFGTVGSLIVAAIISLVGKFVGGN